MKTEMFADRAAFNARTDLAVNGVSPEFAVTHPEWTDELGNEGCWNCSDCSHCFHCTDCSDCSRCFHCSRCSGKIGDVEPSSAVPTIPHIHQRVLEAVTATPESLNMSTWHTCETTHCRAGWVVTLAGDAGRALEAFHNTAFAALLIYKASSPLRVHMGRLYDSNEDALADMRRLAHLEAAADVTGSDA